MKWKGMRERESEREDLAFEKRLLQIGDDLACAYDHA